MNKININIKDKSVFTKVAFLVDRDSFLEAIAKARKALKILKLLPASSFYTNNNKELKIGLQNNLSYLLLFKEDPAIFIMELTYEVEQIRLQHGASKSLNWVIAFSILCGEVSAEDFRLSTYLFPTPDYEGDGTIKLDHTEAAIIINPQSTEKEVEQLLKQYKKKFKGYIKKYSSIDTVNDIEIHREWYWMNKSGMSAYKIWEKLTKENEIHLEPKTVEAALTQYKRRLEAPLYPPS